MSIPMKDIIKKFLLSVCGFTTDAAKDITKNQGYDDLGKFYLLDDKGVNTLCSIVRSHTRRPGGLQATMPTLTLHKNRRGEPCPARKGLPE
jgi:hypothetical protein